jgi:hypothetical protein
MKTPTLFDLLITQDMNEKTARKLSEEFIKTGEIQNDPISSMIAKYWHEYILEDETEESMEACIQNLHGQLSYVMHQLDKVRKKLDQ